MGNQHSATDGDRRPGPFSRSTGALGLSRSELDKRCQPSGLYDASSWDDKAVRKLVGDGRVVARLKGCERRTIDSNQECPICFLYYPEINVTKCCSANICTECYLQVRPQKEKYSSCPFCNNPKLSIGVAKKLSAEQIKERENEEKKAFDARMKAQQQGTDSKDKATTTAAATASSDEITPDNTIDNTFGSNLAKDQRVALMRARSESMASSEGGTSNTSASADDNSVHSFAMSVDERRRLEEEMRAQHSHPLALRVEAEAAERRLQNDRAFYRSNSDSARRARAADLFRHHAGISSSSSRRRGRAQSSRDWNQIVDAWERGGNGEVQSIDDLVVLEAAILLSMEEESRRSREEGEEFDAARHAREGFPLVRTFLTNRRDDSTGSSSSSSLTAGATPAELQSLARNLSSNRRRNQLLRATQGGRAARSTSSMPDTAMETASMLMRGISEEEQIAMAIAASLQEQQNDQNSSTDTDANANNGDSEDATPNQTTSGSTTESRTRRSAELRLGNGETAVVGVVVEEDSEEENDGDEAEVNQGVGVAVGVSVGEGDDNGETADSLAPDTANTSPPAAGDTNPQSQIQLESGIAIETGTDDAIPIDNETEAQL